MRSNKSHRVNLRRKGALIRRTDDLAKWKAKLHAEPENEAYKEQVSRTEVEIQNIKNNLSALA